LQTPPSCVGPSVLDSESSTSQWPSPDELQHFVDQGV
jgi:hypothetical protein